MSGSELRIAIFSRYNLTEQYGLAAEFEEMLKLLASRAKVFHISLRGPHNEAVIPPGVEVNELPMLVDRAKPRDVALKFLLSYLLLPVAAARLRKFKPHAIFVSEILPLMPLFLKVFVRTNVATAYGDWHIHNWLGRKTWAKPLLRLVEFLDRFESRRIDGFFCRAAAAGERLKSWGVKPESIRVVRDAPDPAAFYPRDESELRRRCGFEEEDVVLLYHGVMHQGKGLDKLLTWTADLYRENSRIAIILVGGGPEQEALRALARKLQLGNRSVFAGWLKTIEQVGAYCNAADICIAMRTAAEANDKVVPGALLHSMACRKVVIGPALRGICEIIEHGVNGYVFQPDDGDSFKQLVRALVARRSQWEVIATRAYQDVQEKYSVKASAKQYAQALEHFASL